MKRALVIDDSATMRRINQKHLEKLGWVVNTATDGLDALRVVTQLEDIELILTDIHMPHMDGIEFTHNLRSRERFKKTKIMMITSDGAMEVIAKAIAAGADDVLIKPFTPSDFEMRVESLVNG